LAEHREIELCAIEGWRQKVLKGVRFYGSQIGGFPLELEEAAAKLDKSLKETSNPMDSKDSRKFRPKFHLIKVLLPEGP
jgi:hypothetical protein